MQTSIISLGWLTWLSVILFFLGIDTLNYKEKSGYEKLFNVDRNPILVLAERLGPTIALWFPVANIDGIEEKLTWANKPYNLTAELFIGIKFVALGIGLIIGSGLTLIGFPSIFILVIAAICYFVPDSLLNSKVEQRKKQIQKGMPAMLNFLITSLRAGVELVPALNTIGAQLTGPLGEELRKATREMATGKPRALALREMAKRTGVDEVERFVQTLVVVEERGSSNFAEGLDEYSKELTNTRIRKAEEEARKIPTKIIGPLILCIFLPLIILLLAPIMSIIKHTL